MSPDYDTLLSIIDDEIPGAAARLDMRFRAELRTSLVYIPAPDKTERNHRIRAEFNGRNLRDIMRRHGVSRATVYSVVKRGQTHTRGTHT